MTNKTNDVIALGNALMDFLVEVDDQYLNNLNLNKGEFHSIEEAEAKELLNKIQHLNIETVPGGSSANTLKTLASLGGKTIFCSRVGNDSHGENYIQEMNSLGVQTKINKHESITGHAITFITPDSERTFSVHLGANLKINNNDLSEEDIKNSKILHIEGYHLGASTKETAIHAIDLAKKHHTLVSLDLSDAGVVKKNKETFQNILNKIDILFANETEAEALTDLKPEQAVQQLAQTVKIAIVKIGKEGSLICQDGLITMIPGCPANAIDTTGAGDTYSAGFLYGYLNNWPLERAGKLGSLLASKIVEQKGANINKLNLEELKNKFT
jgi:sugar/nucleoside kinase (ribokinase family)